MTKLVKAAGSEAFRVITAAEDLKIGLAEASEAVAAIAECSAQKTGEVFTATEITVVLIQKN